MAINKVEFGGRTLIDLTDTTATADKILTGYGAYGKDGVWVDGTVPSGTAGTPTATKGTVSNHSVSVTPSVTNTTGYITGGTVTGAAVNISASELVSGSQTITTNDTYDVTNLASVTVNVSGGVTPTGTINITTNGTHDVTNYATANVNVSGGGSSKKQINFIDYDGTIVQSYSANEWANVTSLPSNPSHTGLVAQGWNWTKAQIDAQLTALPDGDIWIGQMYITESGDTEIDVRFSDSARLSPILTICVNGTVTVDWGDNTTPDTVTGSSLTTQKSVPHTYASAGNYTIVIHVVSGSFQFYNGSNSYTLLHKNATPSSNENRVYSNCVKNVRIGSSVTSIGVYAFYNCYSLASITIPSNATSIGSSAFYNCYGMAECHILPTNVPTLGTTVFNNNASDRIIYVPSGTLSDYQSATNWSKYASYMVEESA